MSIITTTEYRDWAGLQASDPPTDALIQKYLNQTQTLVESFLCRKLAYGRYTDQHLFIDTPSIILSNYPVQAIHAIQSDQTVVGLEDIVLNRRTGEFWHKGLAGSEKLLVEYTGGFQNLPDDLRIILMMLTSNAINTDPAMGGSGAVPTGGSGDISSITLDGMTIRYDVGSSGAASDDSGLSGLAEKWGLPAPWLDVLLGYRAPCAPGMGIA